MTLWIMIAALSMICLLPCFFVLFRHNTMTGKEAVSPIQLYQAQLQELKQEFQNQLILPNAYEQAKLEIQRRILREDQEKSGFSSKDTAPRTGLFFIAAGLTCIPLAAVGLYLLNGNPSLPSQPLQARLEAQQKASQEIAPYVQQLKNKLAQLSPSDPRYGEGYMLLGKIEADQGNLKEAINAWKKALEQQFDPTLAVQIAEAQTQLDGYVSKESQNLFQQALKAAPQGAPWRNIVEQRLIQYQKNIN